MTTPVKSPKVRIGGLDLSKENFEIVLRSALREAIDENDILKKSIEEITKVNNRLKRESNDKDTAISELATIINELTDGGFDRTLDLHANN
jgi:FtsZ-binding cell division protein ZapB